MREQAVMATVMVVGAASLAGCASENKARLLVTVADATSQRGLAGAKVQADTGARNHPFSIASMLGKTGPLTSAAYTDELGQARVEYLEGRPVRIGVLLRGYPLTTKVIDEAWLGRTTITGAAPERVGGGALEIMVEPDGSVEKTLE